jgi:hypothetical protein
MKIQPLKTGNPFRTFPLLLSLQWERIAECQNLVLSAQAGGGPQPDQRFGKRPLLKQAVPRLGKYLAERMISVRSTVDTKHNAVQLVAGYTVLS